MKILALSDEVVPWIYSPTLRERCGDVGLIVGCGDLPYYYLEYVVTVLTNRCTTCRATTTRAARS